VVADHQIGGHQGGMKLSVAPPAFQRGDAMKLPRRSFLHLAAGAAALSAIARVAKANAVRPLDPEVRAPP